MTDNEIKEKILDYVRKNEGTSYVEIERIFEENSFDYKGNLETTAGKEYPNVILWSGWNKRAFDIIKELLSSGSVIRQPCQPIVYMIDGKMLTYPIQKSSSSHNTPHWLPCAFSAKPLP